MLSLIHIYPKIGQDIFIPKASFNGAKIGAKVVVEITKWPENRRSAEGKVIEVIGYIGDPGIDILTVIKKHDLPLEFPVKVVKESENVPETIDQAEITGRRDLREFSIVTICLLYTSGLAKGLSVLTVQLVR